MKAQEIDEKGDVIFRFRLKPVAPELAPPLEEHYRRSIRELLRIVRLYKDGRPVVIDSFAFHNDKKLIALMPLPEDPDGDRR